MAAAIAVLVVTLGLPACGPNTPVGSVLDSLRTEVAAVLSQATAAGDALLITAAGQASLAIDNATSAFADKLNESLDKVDDSVVRSVDNLRAVVKDLNDGTQAALDSAISGSQQLINSLPFTNKNPQVRAYSPGFVAARSGRPLHLTVDGNFWWASHKDLPVRLEHAGTTYRADLVTTAQVGFSLPAGTFDTAAADTRVPLTLTAPFEEGRIFKDVVPGRFTLSVTVLPQRPLTDLQVTNTTHVTGTETHDLTVPSNGPSGGGWDLNSWSDCEDHSDYHAFSATDGWKIVPNSPTVHYTAGGSSSAGQAAVSDSSITGFVVRGSTTEHCFAGISKGSGHITYYVTYVEQREVSYDKTEPIPVEPPLGWGDTWTAPVTRGGWTVNGTLWDGTRIATGSTDVSNKYLRVYDQGDTVQIKVISPEELLNR